MAFEAGGGGSNYSRRAESRSSQLFSYQQKRKDTQDRRNWWITLKSMGRAAAEEVVAGVVPYRRDFLSPLRESEQRALHSLLLKALHGLGFDWQ